MNRTETAADSLLPYMIQALAEVHPDATTLTLDLLTPAIMRTAIERHTTFLLEVQAGQTATAHTACQMVAGRMGL